MIRATQLSPLILILTAIFSFGCDGADSADTDSATPSKRTFESNDLDHPAPNMWALSCLGTVELTYEDDRTHKTGFVLIDSDTIALNASSLFGAKEGTVQLHCCDPKQILGIVAYDMTKDIALVRIDPPVEDFARVQSTELDDSAISILFSLPISFETGPAFSTIPTQVEQHADWTDIGKTLLFKSDPLLVMDGSLVINHEGFPIAMICGWGGGNRGIGVLISEITSLERHDFVEFDRFLPSLLPHEDQSYAHVYESRNLRNGGRFEDALGHAEKGVAINPVNWQGWYELGVLYDILEADLTQAESALKRSVSIEDEWSEGVYSLGLIEYKLGRYAYAIESLKKAIELDPTNPDAHHMLGLSLWDLEGPLEAVSHLEAACDLAPDTIMYLQNLNICFGDLHQPNRGLERTKQFVLDSPDDSEGRRELGLLAFELKDFELARVQFVWLDDQFEPDSDTLIRLFLCELEMNDRSSAKDVLDRLESIDPHHHLLPRLREELTP